MSREGRARWGINQRFVIGQPGNPMMERWRLLATAAGVDAIHQARSRLGAVEPGSH